LKEGAPELLDGADPLGARLRSKPSGQDGSRTTGGEESRGGVTHRRSALGGNSGAVKVVVEVRGLEAKPGLGAEFWESLAGVVARQGDVAAAARCSAPGGGRGVGTGA